MKIIFALLIIILLAFSGYHISFKRLRLPLFAREFHLTGTEFLFLGLLMGPLFFNLLDAPTLQGLRPLEALLLGWIGLLFGFQFEFSKLRRFPIEYMVSAAVAGLLPFAVVFMGTFGVLIQMDYRTIIINLIISLTLASAAACTAQTGLALQSLKDIGNHRELIHLLRFISSFDGISALLIFGLVFILRPVMLAGTSWWNELLQITLISLGISAGLLCLYQLLLKRRYEDSELLVIVIGMVVLSCGMASLLHFSPLLTNFVIGIGIVNTSREKERIFHILIAIEKPVYLLLLVFLGASWRTDSLWFPVLAVFYTLCRFSGKWLGGFIISLLYSNTSKYSPHMGLGLLAQGGLPLAILVEFEQQFPYDFTTGVICTGILAVIYNDIVSPYFLRYLVTRKPI
jgi:hypothetical protein